MPLPAPGAPRRRSLSCLARTIGCGLLGGKETSMYGEVNLHPLCEAFKYVDLSQADWGVWDGGM